jgi:hypothetical protein
LAYLCSLLWKGGEGEKRKFLVENNAACSMKDYTIKKEEGQNYVLAQVFGLYEYGLGSWRPFWGNGLCQLHAGHDAGLFRLNPQLCQ